VQLEEALGKLRVREKRSDVLSRGSLSGLSFQKRQGKASSRILIGSFHRKGEWNNRRKVSVGQCEHGKMKNTPLPQNPPCEGSIWSSEGGRETEDS